MISRGLSFIIDAVFTIIQEKRLNTVNMISQFLERNIKQFDGKGEKVTQEHATKDKLRK